MNYLSHHYIARRIRPEPDASALFFAGNLLPDLLSIAGDGRLRTAGESRGPLSDGVRLHLATDKRFHSLPAFIAAQAEATRMLIHATWEAPLRRRFFVAHVITELALDSVVLAQQPDLPEELYTALSESLKMQLITQTETLAARVVPNLPDTIERFVESRFLYRYATPPGLATSMIRIGRRAGIPNFEPVADALTLSQIFADFSTWVASRREDLLCVPPLKPEE